MNVIRNLFVALLVAVATASPALALPVNSQLTVQLSGVAANGRLTTLRAGLVTSDANGKANFAFSAVPTVENYPYLLVRVFDSNSVLIRQSMVPAPTANGSVTAAVSEVTSNQATAMLKAFADAGAGNSTLAAMVVTMVRSGATSDADLTGLSPLARNAASAFESFLANNGAADKLPAFRDNLTVALRQLAADYKTAVDAAAVANDVTTTNPQQDLLNKAAANEQEAIRRGDAMANFLTALVQAGVDAGIDPQLMQVAFTEAGSAAEQTGAGIGGDVQATLLAAFRIGAQHCQLTAELKTYAAALPFFNLTTAARGQQCQIATAKVQTGSTAVANGLVAAMEEFEKTFVDPGAFPTPQDIAFARDLYVQTAQSLTANFIATGTASAGEIASMQSIMAAGMAQMGGVMAGVTTTTLQQAGIGTTFTSPSASSQNWLSLMAAGADLVNPAVQLSYSSSVTNLAGRFPTLAVPPFAGFADPYKSLLRLQFDLLLLKFNNIQALAQAGQPVSQQALALIKENDLALRSTLAAGLVAPDALKGALVTALTQPELL